MDARIPSAFGTAGLQSATVPLGLRDGIDEHRAAALVDLVDAVDWEALTYAYGPAGAARGQLIAAAVGDDATRERAWEDLWAGIWHQGTVYEATGPAVPLLAALAAWGSYPDRVRALVWVLTATPELRAAHADLVDEVLPAEHRHGFNVAVDGAWENDEEYDASCALEAWALS